jgi:hypothetical protein
MGSSFVEFRGRGFWAKDTPLQVAMFGIARAIGQADESNGVMAKFRDTLQEQMIWGGGGCVYTGVDDIPDSEPVDPIARAVAKAMDSLTEWLTADELTRARVGWGGFESAPQHWNWNGVESDGYTVSATKMVLAAFLELLTGTIEAEYGQLVYDAESEDAHARMIPGGDWRVAKAEADAREAAETERLLASPDERSSFGPDAVVRFIPLDRSGTAGES